MHEFHLKCLGMRLKNSQPMLVYLCFYSLLLSFFHLVRVYLRHFWYLHQCNRLVSRGTLCFIFHSMKNSPKTYWYRIVEMITQRMWKIFAIPPTKLWTNWVELVALSKEHIIHDKNLNTRNYFPKIIQKRWRERESEREGERDKFQY